MADTRPRPSPTARPYRNGPTRRGWVFGVVGALTLGIGLAGGGENWQRVGLLLLGLLVVSALVVAQPRLRLNGTRHVYPQRAPVDSETTVNLDLAAASFMPAGMVRLQDNVPGSGSQVPRFVVDRGGYRWTRRLTYRLRPRHRGLLEIGPLTVFVGDPFGMVVATHQLAGVSSVVVTPHVVPLPMVRIPGEWTGSGESRPRAIAAAGEEDVTVRPYQYGDDRRRVHWRASARHDELMVRNEEQPWQSRATLVLDARDHAHSTPQPGRQTPATCSFEWSVSAVASIGSHLLTRGYAVRMVTNEGGETSAAWHDRSEGSGSAEGQLLEALAMVEATETASIGRIRGLLHGAGTSSGLLVAVLGRLTAAEAATIARLSHETSAALAVLVDPNAWHPSPSARNWLDPHTAALTLQRSGWHVVVMGEQDPKASDVATLWGQLGDQRSLRHAPAGVPT